MLESTKEYVEDLWWVVVLQGAAAALFGVVALFLPKLTAVSLLLIFAAYLLVFGVLELIHGVMDIGRRDSWWFSLLVGVAAVGLSVYLVRNPHIALGAFVVLLGAALLVRGVSDLVIAAFFTENGQHRWLWIITGALGIIAGVVVWRYPLDSTLAFVWVLGLYAVLAGVITVAYAMRVRGEYNKLTAKLTKK